MQRGNGYGGVYGLFAFDNIGSFRHGVAVRVTDVLH